MGRKEPEAVVYQLRNNTSGKIYIGETSNFADRMSAYRTVSRGRSNVNSTRPIDIAMREYGFNDFEVKVLLSSTDDPRVNDPAYRKMQEAHYIWLEDARDPDIGYNVEADNRVMNSAGHRKGVKCKVSTKILKSDEILGYNVKQQSVMWFIGSQSCANILGISDRSMIIKAIKTGNCSHGYVFFKLNYQKRYNTARGVIARKLIDDTYHDRNKMKRQSLMLYVDALLAVNEWCKAANIREVDLNSLLNEIYERDGRYE